MTQTSEAIYTNGALKPTGDLDLREQQRVRASWKRSTTAPMIAPQPSPD